jgi:hypothetical protein
VRVILRTVGVEPFVLQRGALAIVGTNATMDEDKDKGLVQGLLDFKEAMEGYELELGSSVHCPFLRCTLYRVLDALLNCRMVVNAFGGLPVFSAALKGALEGAINSRENKPAELIGWYHGVLNPALSMILF